MRGNQLTQVHLENYHSIKVICNACNVVHKLESDTIKGDMVLVVDEASGTVCDIELDK